MLGGYNIQPLVKCLATRILAGSSNALSKTLLIFDAFNEILNLSETNKNAKAVIDVGLREHGFKKRGC